MFNRDALREILHTQEKTLEVLKHILRLLEIEQGNFPSGFTITQTGATLMANAAPDPGNTLQFTATPLPAGSSLGSVIPTWTSSDSANVTLTVDPTGLIATAVLSTSIAIGESVTITTTAINPADPSGATVATGSITFTIGASPASFPTSFGIVQTQ
jgi:hypothetical protein